MDLSPEGMGLRQVPQPPSLKLWFLLFDASPMQPLLKQKEEGGLEGEPGQPQLCFFFPVTHTLRGLRGGAGGSSERQKKCSWHFLQLRWRRLRQNPEGAL